MDYSAQWPSSKTFWSELMLFALGMIIGIGVGISLWIIIRSKK
jgi:hypothetical protein